MPKVLLSTLNSKYIHLNLAIRILYDLNKEAADLHWHEFTIKQDPKEIAAHCAQFDVVCFSCYIWNITQTLEVCALIKAHNPSIKILLGGPEVSYEWQPVIAHDFVDFIVVGEGELPFAHFLKAYPHVESVPNLVYKLDDGVHFNKQELQFNILELEGRNPYQYDDPADLYNKVSYIETSRGCPYKCAFCLASLDNKMRYLPNETLKNNLLYLMQHGRVIKFLDRTFNIKKDFTIDLFQFILDHHRPENVFQFEITADIVHPDIIAFINEKVPKGLFRFEIGIQTTNQESNRAVERKQNFTKTSSVINQLKDRVEMHLDLIVGLPLERLPDLKRSFEDTFKLYPPELQLGFLKFLKGTPVREQYAQYGYKFDPEPPYQIIESDFMTAEELQQVTLLEEALEIYWNKKRAINTLVFVAERYSVFDFLSGLGQLFHERSDPHKHTLKEIFQILHEYASSNFEDAFLMQLIAVDYYSYYKVKPQDLFGIEWSKSLVQELCSALDLDQRRYRYAVFSLEHDLQRWREAKILDLGPSVAVLQFDGRNPSRLLQFETEQLNKAAGKGLTLNDVAKQ